MSVDAAPDLAVARRLLEATDTDIAAFFGSLSDETRRIRQSAAHRGPWCRGGRGGRHGRVLRMGHGADERHFDTLELTIDAVDVEKTAAFWAAALGYAALYRRAPYVVLGPRNEGGLRLVVQRVEQRDECKSPVHLDLRVHDPSHEVERLTALGARTERVVEEAGKQWTVMTDPEGTVFCVCPARRGSEGPGSSR